MAFETYEEFDDTMTDILSSGPGDDVTSWHKKQLAELFSGMDRDSLIEQINIYYVNEYPSNLRNGELEVVAELINELYASPTPVSPNVRIVFE